MPQKNNFPCTGCGLCCRSIGTWIHNAKQLIAAGQLVSPAVHEVAEFPHPVRQDGSCSQLGENNQCNIYDHRPDICNIDKTWKKHEKKLTLAEYHEAGIAVCNSMILAAGLDGKYIIQ